MATKIRPIVFKINEPEGLTFNASNCIYSDKPSGAASRAIWTGPDNPNGCDFNGKTYKVTISEDISIDSNQLQFGYGLSNENPGGPTIFTININAANNTITAGTYTGTANANAAGASSGYGKYLFMSYFANYADVESNLSKITIQILD